MIHATYFKDCALFPMPYLFVCFFIYMATREVIAEENYVHAFPFCFLLYTKSNERRMTRMSPSELKKNGRRKSRPRKTCPPSIDELKRALLGLRSFTDDIQHIKNAYVPDDYDVALLTAQFSRLTLNTTRQC